MEEEKLNLNRSFSESDLSNFPSFRQIELVYQSENCDRSSIRFSSCDQIYDNSKNVIYERTFSFISNVNIQNNRSIDYKDHLYNSGDFSPHANAFEPVNYVSRLKFRNGYVVSNSNNQNGSLAHHQSYQEYSPMEVDNSDDDYYENNHFERILDTRKARRLNSHQEQKDLQVVKRSQKINKSPCLKIITVILVAILAVCCAVGLIFQSPVDIPQDNEFIQKIVLSLNKVQCQDHPKTVVIQNLKHLYNNEKSKKVLVFVGSTGVGKTYTANLIRKHVHTIDINFHLKSHLNGDKIKSLNSDECHFIIIDDLKIENLSDVLSYIDKLPDICTLIVPIFNIHTVDDHLVYTVNYEHYDQIKNEFLKKFASNVDTILFNHISRDNLEVWMNEQIKEKNLGNLEDIISLLDDHDVQSYGFKGLSAKMNVLGS